MSATFVRFAAGLLLLGAFAPARAQEYPPTNGDAFPQAGAGPEVGKQPTTTLKVSTRIVVLDVVVTDKKGNLVQRDLSRDDFQILEDGQPQKIRSFEKPAEHNMPAPRQPGQMVVNSSADLKKIGDAPVTILVLDELNSQFSDMSYARSMMKKYLQSQPAVLPQPTSLMFATNTKFEQAHDYTQSRDALIETIDKHMPQYPWRMANSGKSGAGAVERMAQILAGLQQIAQASSGTPGRKNLVWVGNGFPSANLVGLDTQQADLLEAAMRRATARLLASRITMYTINPTLASTDTVDIETPDDLATALDSNGGDPFAGGTVNFTNFAPSTGGLAFSGRNDLNNLIGQSISKGQEYYTLSYSPTNKSDNAAKFRNIRIVMKDPNLRAVTRNGYFPESAGDLNPVEDKSITPKQLQRDLALDLSGALTSVIAYNGLDVSAAKSGSNMWILSVKGNGIGWSEPGDDGSQHEEATVAAGWYDAKGKLLGHLVREQTSPRPRDPNGAATFSLPVPLPSGVARLRFVVRDATNGHMGTVDITKF